MQAILVVFLLLALLVCLGLMVFAALRQDRAKAVYFAAVTIALFVYVLGYLVEVMSGTTEAAITALQVENAGIPFIAPLFLLSMLSLFTPNLVKKWMFPTILAYGFVMFTVVLFNGRHHLYYTSVDRVTIDGLYYFVKLGRGPLYAVQQVVSIGSVLTTYAVVLRRYVLGTNKIRNQMKLMIIGSVIAFSANILNFSGVLQNGLDPTPFTMTIALVFFLISMIRYRLLDLVPIAYATAVDTMEDAIVVLDQDYAFQLCNQSAVQLFPSLKSFQSEDPIELLPGWPMELRDQSAPGEVTFCRKDLQGTDRYYRARISCISSGKNPHIGWSFVMRDITDTTAMMHQLEELATTDPLTGIYNRRQFLSMVNHELEVAARLWLNMSLILYDLDFFKEVNDTYGHIAGDYVLCAVADIIKNQLRPYDIFARYGGEEFVIFTTSNEEFDLMAFADRLRASVERAEIIFEGKRIPTTASFGAVRMKPKTPFSVAMRAVDTAMYQAKTKGRNQVVVTDVSEDKGVKDDAWYFVK